MSLSGLRIGSLMALAALLAALTLHHGVGAQQQPEREQQSAEDRPEGEEGVQCPMMAGLRNIELLADSPPVLAARAQELELDEEQTEKLKEIQREARRQARELLTAEQRRKLEDDPEGSLSMMQLSRLGMRSKMREGDQQGMCPMCMRMMRMKDGESHDFEHQEQQHRE